MSRTNESSAGLDELLRRRTLWRAREEASDVPVGWPTGFRALDGELPGGGWPTSGLIELGCPEPGSAALPLLLPMLARLSRLGSWLSLIAPPHIPYAPSLSACGVDLARLLWIEPRSGDERRWAFEQTLRSGVCRAVVAWSRGGDDGRAFSRAGTRRLQLAAESSSTLGVLVRPPGADPAGNASLLRLTLEHSPGGATVRIDKCRGRSGAARVFLEDVDEAWQPAS